MSIIAPCCPTCGKRWTREGVLWQIAEELYRQSDVFDPSMPDLWHRSGSTASTIHARADAFVAACPALAALIAALPSEDE